MMAATVESREMEPALLPAEETPKRTPGRPKSTPRNKKTPVTVPKPFNLGLDKRIADRKEYQQGLKKRQKDAEEREKRAQDERDEEDKKELKAFRKTLIFKANPIRKYREVEISPSNKDLTCPMAPTFATDARIHHRMSDGASSNGGSISPSHSSNSQPSDSSPV